MKKIKFVRAAILLSVLVVIHTFAGSQMVVAQGVEVYAVEILGVEKLNIFDSKGNTNKPISPFLETAVPGVDYEYGSAPDEDYISPHRVNFANNATFDIKFKTTSVNWMSIDILRGVQRNSPSLVIRYLDFRDLGIPAGVNAWLRFTPHGVSDLRYDADGNGTFETIVKPQFRVTGQAAKDITEPTIDIRSVISGTTATVTITATDNETGVKNLRYQTDDSEIKPYSGPFQIDISRPRAVLAVADDLAGNRKTVAQDFNLNPSVHGADPFNLRSKPR